MPLFEKARDLETQAYGKEDQSSGVQGGTMKFPPTIVVDDDDDIIVQPKIDVGDAPTPIQVRNNEPERPNVELGNNDANGDDDLVGDQIGDDDDLEPGGPEQAPAPVMQERRGMTRLERELARLQSNVDHDYFRQTHGRTRSTVETPAEVSQPPTIPTENEVNDDDNPAEPTAEVHWSTKLVEYCFVSTDGCEPPGVVYNASLHSDPGIDVPKHYKDIERTQNREGWERSVNKELDNLVKRNVFGECIQLPPGGRALSTRWIFKWKQDPNDPNRRFEKAQLVVRGYEQIPGVDFTESFSPVASDAAIRTVLAVTLYYASKFKDWTIDIVDVETAFLNAPLSEVTYIKVPEGYAKYRKIESKPDEVVKLNRALYGLVQSPRAWLKHFVSILEKCGLTVCQSEPCVLFQRRNEQLKLVVVIYVDDCIIAGHKTNVAELKADLQKHIVISDLGQLRKHLGVNYKFGRDELGAYLEARMTEFRDEIVEDCEKYLGRVKHFPTPGYCNFHLMKNGDNEAVMNPEYRSIIGKALYLSKKVEPTCANVIRELGGHLDNPGEQHWKVVARLAGYLANSSRPLKMRPPDNLRIIGCVDSDWANDRNDRKSIGGYLLTVGNCLVDWASKKQASIALSSTEAEYMAYSDAAGSIKYLQMLTQEIVGSSIKPSVLFEDNTGAIHLVNNDHIGKRTKHIDIRYRFVNAMIKEGELVAKFRRSENNTADIMTKNVTEKLFIKHSTNVYDGRIFTKEEMVEANEQNVVALFCGGSPANKEDVEDRKFLYRSVGHSSNRFSDYPLALSMRPSTTAPVHDDTTQRPRSEDQLTCSRGRRGAEANVRNSPYAPAVIGEYGRENSNGDSGSNQVCDLVVDRDIDPACLPGLPQLQESEWKLVERRRKQKKCVARVVL